MGRESSSPPCVFLSADVGRRLFPDFFAGRRSRWSGHKVREFARNAVSHARNASVWATLATQSGLIRLRVASGETKPGLDLGDLGAADGHAMRRWAIELDDRAVTLLADEADMGDRHNMAAMHPDEQAWIKLGFGLRNRPRAHPLPGAVMDPGIMSVGPDAPDIGGIDEMRAVGPLDRKPGRRRRAGRLAEAAERRRHRPRHGCGSRNRIRR